MFTAPKISEHIANWLAPVSNNWQRLLSLIPPTATTGTSVSEQMSPKESTPKIFLTISFADVFRDGNFEDVIRCGHFEDVIRVEISRV